ncbi:MAG: hypothetical protein ACKO85_20905 [Isosphaeraceae bacterium]
MHSSFIRKSLVLGLFVSSMALAGCGGAPGAPEAGVIDPGPKKNAGGGGAEATGKGAPVETKK